MPFNIQCYNLPCAPGHRCATLTHPLLPCHLHPSSFKSLPLSRAPSRIPRCSMTTQVSTVVNPSFAARAPNSENPPCSPIPTLRATARSPIGTACHLSRLCCFEHNCIPPIHTPRLRGKKKDKSIPPPIPTRLAYHTLIFALHHLNRSRTGAQEREKKS